jgi:hypothetical protein
MTRIGGQNELCFVQLDALARWALDNIEAAKMVTAGPTSEARIRRVLAIDVSLHVGG